MSNSNIKQNLFEIRQSIRQYAAEAGREPDEIRLIAVSKTIDIPRIWEAYNVGHRDFGENRIQELQRKKEQLPDDIIWHMIGHLQTNKAKIAVGTTGLIHSIDSLRLLRKTNDIAAVAKIKQMILIQVNISGEQSKSGAGVEDAKTLLQETMNLDHVDCRGLMTMAPQNADENELHRVFGELRRFRNRMANHFDMELPELSMGMSGDYRIAIAEGATLIRIGTAIFGGRNISVE